MWYKLAIERFKLNDGLYGEAYYNNKHIEILVIVIHINLKLILTLISIQNFINFPHDV